MTSDDACGACVKGMRSFKLTGTTSLRMSCNWLVDLQLMWSQSGLGATQSKLHFVPETFCDNVASIQIRAPVLNIKY